MADSHFPPHAAPEQSEAADSPSGYATAPHLCANPPDPRERGVVMVIALIAIMLIASLVFYVINVGSSVQGRIVTQHAADAAAVGGASQVARSMNTVAMNNVETTKLIIAVSMLDSIPMAVDMAVTHAGEEELGDTDAVAQAINGQLRQGVVDVWFEAKLRELMDASDPESVVSAQRHLHQLDDLFRNQPDLVPEMTWYEAPSGEMGKMHQAMRSMDAHSRAVMQTMGEAAQSAATRSVQANLGNDELGSAGMLLPVSPNIPWQRGVFDDFERPVKKGLLPGVDQDMVMNAISNPDGLGQVDDEVIRRGPWDALFGWRRTDGYPGGFSSYEGGGLSGFPGPPVRSDAGSGVNYSPPREATEYYVTSPESVMLGYLPSIGHSRLGQRVWDLYSIKANYLWPGTITRTINDPNWEIDIDHDDERSSDPNDEYAYGVTESDIRDTAFVVIEMKSRVANDPGHPGRQGVTWNYIDRGVTPVWFRGGWRDPRDGPIFRIDPNGVTSGPTWRKVQDHIWRISATYETNPDSPNQGGDPDIGLPPIQTGTDADGNPTFAAQEVHWEIDVMLVGVNVGTDVDVNNPWEGFDRNSEDAPAPVDLIHALVPPNDNASRQLFFTFMGVAREPSRPGFWPTRFNGDRAYPYNTAIAQSRVFNNHSWDLWTQTWQAKLEPVSHFDDWVKFADLAADGAAVIDGLDPDEAQQMADYLRSVQELADVMLTH